MSKLRCPSCRSVYMKAYTDPADDLEIDACAQCDGMWFDANELARFLKSRLLKDRFLHTESEPLSSVGFVINSSARTCPRCEIKLTAQTCAGIVLDICARCHGLWFDDGEVRQVYERYKAGTRGGATAVLSELKKAHEASSDKLHTNVVSALMEFFRSAIPPLGRS